VEILAGVNICERNGKVVRIKMEFLASTLTKKKQIKSGSYEERVLTHSCLISIYHKRWPEPQVSRGYPNLTQKEHLQVHLCSTSD
jgi:hypothetical protein